ncbi:MAG: sugar ABC transporter permease [Chloroflexi bacterium]|nr:sugar ABC transporter permease [Chloroflexota bacterium]
MTSSGDLIHVVTDESISATRRRAGRILTRGSFAILVVVLGLQALDALGIVALGFRDWQPTAIAWVVWAVCLCVGQVLIRGEQGKRILFVLPSALLVVSLTVIPLILGIAIAFSDWNLSSRDGPRFAGLGNIERMLNDRFYWNALGNMVWYVLAVVVEIAVAFGLALLLNAQIRARRFFRVAFLLPLMLSPVAVSWMIGKSMLEFRFGPVPQLARALGWDSPAFFASNELAKVTMMVIDAWIFIPFMMIMLLAGLQALSHEVVEAARVDGATAWQTFWRIVFPLMLPVTLTALIVRIIFKLKLADLVINITSGGPGGATDTVTSFIYREYRDRSNVGYGTLLAVFYLVLIVVVLTVLLRPLGRRLRPYG